MKKSKIKIKEYNKEQISRNKSKNIKNKKRIKKLNRNKNYIYYKFLLIILNVIIILLLERKNNLTSRKDKIIYKNSYAEFEIMKNRFISINDSLALSHIEQITILNHTFNKNYKQLKKNKNNINICVNLDGRYAYKLIVSMESVLSNCDKQKTFITYHILCAPDVRENSLIILKSLMKRYSSNLEMVFYGMGNNFMYLKHTRLSQVTYYRLLLALFINSDRILYLDGDTITYKDISVIFELDFKDTYVLGTLDYKSDGVDYLGLKSNIYINAGVILINLEKIRKDRKYIELINITRNKRLENDDQTAMNYVFYPKIGRFPIKYNVFTFYDKSDINFYLRSLRTKVNVTLIKEALYDPMIMHSVGGPKFWQNHYKRFDCSKKKDCSCDNYHCIWLSYANKTDYYQEIISSLK